MNLQTKLNIIGILIVVFWVSFFDRENVTIKDISESEKSEMNAETGHRMMKKGKIEIYVFIIACIFNMCTIAMGAAIPNMGEVFGQDKLPLIQMSMNFAGVAAATVSLFQSRFQKMFSHKTLLLTGLSLFLIAGIGAYTVHGSVMVIFIWTGLMGAGSAMYYPLVSSIITERYSGAQRGSLLAMQTAVSNMGGIIMSVVGGFLVAWKWYGCFLVNLLAIPVLAVCMWGTSFQKTAIAETEVTERISGRINWGLIGKFFGVSFSFALIYFVATPNISVFVEEHAMGDSGLSGLGAASLMIGGMISGFSYKKVVVRLKSHTAEFGIALAGIGYLILTVSGKSAVLLLIGCCMTGISYGIAFPYFLFLISNQADKSTIGTAMGVIGTCSGALASFVSPLVFTELGRIIGLVTAQKRFAAACICCIFLFVLHCYLRVSGRGNIYEHR